jgi:uncharacterized protein YjbJ (UPF0337 family)
MSKQAAPPVPPQQEPGNPIKTAQHETAQHVGNVRQRVAEAAAPGTDAVLAKWKKHIGSARIVWSKLSDKELLETEGRAEKLASLVEERYAISREVAGRRVRNFLQQYKLPTA